MENVKELLNNKGATISIPTDVAFNSLKEIYFEGVLTGVNLNKLGVGKNLLPEMIDQSFHNIIKSLMMEIGDENCKGGI